MSAEVIKLTPDRRLYEECWEASGYDNFPKGSANKAAQRSFFAMAKKNGYHDACDKWRPVCELERKLTRAILKIPANSRIGDGVHAAAALIEEPQVCEEAAEKLWEMAARAGFCPPADIAKRLKRRGIVTTAKIAREAVQS